MNREKVEISFIVNNQPVRVAVDPGLRLLDVLREELHLAGTKEGCGKGECGACTVIMDGKAVDSCLIMGYQAEGAQITTIEGLGCEDQLHPLQQAFMDKGSVQCGICIPGMIVAAKALIDEIPQPTVEDIKYGLAGNLCRCTGYVKIFEAVKQAAVEVLSGRGKTREKPAASETSESASPRYTPRTLAEALTLLAEHGDQLYCVAGGTDILVKAKDGHYSTRALFDIFMIRELHGIEERNGNIWFGSMTTHDELVRSPLIQKYAPALVAGCAIIGGPQIRNRGTVGGNLGNASPAADAVPPLYTLETTVELVSLKGKRTIPIEQFFVGPGKTVLERGELIAGLYFPKRDHLKGAFLRLGQRQAQAISKVSLGLSAQSENGAFKYLRIALGAVAPTVIRAYKTEEVLLKGGRNPKTLAKAKQLIKQEARPIDDLRSSREYRQEMCAVLLERALSLV
jgi:carbon-monoxide dehydrogenase small subunit/xanthine dehydrogenase small subunit